MHIYMVPIGTFQKKSAHLHILRGLTCLSFTGVEERISDVGSSLVGVRLYLTERCQIVFY